MEILEITPYYPDLRKTKVKKSDRKFRKKIFEYRICSLNDKNDVIYIENSWLEWILVGELSVPLSVSFLFSCILPVKSLKNQPPPAIS